MIAKAIAINPKDASYYIYRGNALKEMKQWIMAVASYDKAILAAPGHFEAYFNRANVLKSARSMRLLRPMTMLFVFSLTSIGRTSIAGAYYGH